MAGVLQGISPVAFESVSAVTASPSVQLGTRRFDGGIDYIYVYNDGGFQISQGQFAVLAGGSQSLTSGYSVTVTNAASQSGAEKMVGVAHNATLTTATYGWLATRGVVLVSVDTSAVSMNAGDVLAPGVDGGFVARAGTSATAPHCGVALNSLVTTVGTGKAFFKAPIFG